MEATFSAISSQQHETAKTKTPENSLLCTILFQQQQQQHHQNEKKWNQTATISNA